MAERQLELAALQADLRLLCRSERFLSGFDPQGEARDPAAPARRAQ